MATAVVSPTARSSGPVRRAREAVPAALWEKQIGLLVRDYP
ncbi:hypothetical protein [Streptomyces sp. NPDC087300]